MKNILVLAAVAVVFFSISEGLSVYLNMPKAEDKEKDTAKKKSTDPDIDPNRPVVKPGLSDNKDDLAKMALEYQDQKKALKEREDRLGIRQRQLETIMSDMRSEREVIDRLRNQITAETKLLVDKSVEIDTKYKTLEDQRKELLNRTADYKKNVTEYSKDEQTNLTKIAAIYDSMSPENAAKTLQEMANTGKMDLAVKVLSLMKQSKSAKVISEMTDDKLAVQLLDRLRGLKTPPATDMP